MELAPDVARGLLERWPVARLATLSPGGRPHLVAVVFARSGESLWSPVDAKPKAGRELARVRNVRARPRASLLLDHYEADWSQLWWLRVEGRAAVLEGRETDAALAAPAAALRAKYPQYATLRLFRGEPQLIEIAVSRVRSWCAGPAAAAAAAAWLAG